MSNISDTEAFRQLAKSDAEWFTLARNARPETVAIGRITGTVPDRILKFWKFCGHQNVRGMGKAAAPGISAVHCPGGGMGCSVTITCSKDEDLPLVAEMLRAAIMRWAVLQGEAEEPT